MPFALLILGAVLLVAAVRGTQDDLFTLVKGDFTGNGNFLYWVVVLLIIGAVGYIPKLKPLSDAFLVLMVVVIFIKAGNPQSGTGGFFSKFTSAIGSTSATQQTTTQKADFSLPSLPTLPTLGVA